MIKKLPASSYKPRVKEIFEQKGLMISDESYFERVLDLVKDRCTMIGDFWDHSFFFFKAPKEFDTTAFIAKWNEGKMQFFKNFSKALASVSAWNAASLETLFKQLAEQAGVKPGELQLPLRIMLVGGKFGPPVFNIAEVLGKQETIDRIDFAILQFTNIK